MLYLIALQIDFARHSLDGVKVTDNLQDGLGVLYSDIYSADAINTVTNCDFSHNGGSGISFKQLGMRIISSRIESNKVAGIRHNPVLSAVEQREFSGWFLHASDTTYRPVILPEIQRDIELANGETKYIISSKVSGKSISRVINIKVSSFFRQNVYFSHMQQVLIILCKLQCTPGYVIGIQLLNPIENRSTEQIILHDSPRSDRNHTIWHVKRDLSVFPVSSSSFAVILEYFSGENALGGTVMIVTSILAPAQVCECYILSKS